MIGNLPPIPDEAVEAGRVGIVKDPADHMPVRMPSADTASRVIAGAWPHLYAAALRHAANRYGVATVLHGGYIDVVVPSDTLRWAADEAADCLPRGRHRAEIDVQREKGWTDFHPEDYCHRCGGRNVYSWHAPDDVWNAAVGDRWDGIVCPQCFTDLARLAGVDPSVWLLIDGDTAPALAALVEAWITEEYGCTATSPRHAYYEGDVPKPCPGCRLRARAASPVTTEEQQ